LCNDGGKKFYKWTYLEKSKRLIKFYNEKTRPCKSEGGSTFYEIKGDNQNENVAKITGQYVQKELILDIASWISVEFYDKCNEIIVDFFVSEFKAREEDLQKQICFAEQNMHKLCLENEEVIREKDDKIYELLEMTKRMEQDRLQDRKLLRSLGVQLDEVCDQNNELLEKAEEQEELNIELHHKIGTIQTKLNIAVEDRAPQPKKPDRQERFMFVKRPDEHYPYYIVRAQNISAKRAIKRQEKQYGNVSILLDLPYHPNSKTLYVRIKENLKKKGVEFNLCSISIKNATITEEELLDAMKVINDEKRDV
jgi:hypothetical protein